MAAVISTTSGKPAMAYVGATPWHGLGTKLEAGASIEDWVDAAGFNYRIKQAFVRYPIDSADTETPENWRTIPDRVVLFRSDTGEHLGIVSNTYKPVQPKAVLEFFRDLTSEAGFALETAGALFRGERYWALARATSDTSILDAKDKVGGYLLLTTTADGTGATAAKWTCVRVVCNNTLTMALRGKAEFRQTHRTRFEPGTAKRALGIEKLNIAEQFEEQMDLFRRLAAKPATQAEMVRMTLETFGYEPQAMSRQELTEASQKPALAAIGHMAITGSGLLGADMRGGIGTSWGWLNAVTQYTDHIARARSQDYRLDRAWFGPGDTLKVKALEIATKHAGGNLIVDAVPQNAVDVLGSVLDASAFL